MHASLCYRDNGYGDAAFKECQTLKTEGIYGFCKTAWDQRPAWMRTMYSGKEGEQA
jgi:hypothetical protein